MPQHYTVKCQLCGAVLEDDGFILECPVKHEAALLLTHYSARRFEPESSREGIFRYHKWLPICHSLRQSSKTVTYQSQKLCDRLSLPNLWIAFNGYWLDKEAMLETTTFKELEAYTVLSRLPQQHQGTLVVSSAGNTAAAFAHVCSQNQVSCLLIVPSQALAKLKLAAPLNPCVRVISLVDADYDDAIQLAQNLAQHESFFLEGGVRNIGRRDGIGTTLLNAIETIGQLPDYYFQAIGSGAGAIAVHEAAKRLVDQGQFGRKLPQLMLSQNSPFMPIYHAWKSHTRQFPQPEGKEQVKQILATVLSNQRPPYVVKGGVYDALVESQGDMLFSDNSETAEAMQLFQAVEGVEIEPAAGVAFASLIKAVKDDQIDPDAIVLLHITGGRCREYDRRSRYTIEPTLQLVNPGFSTETVLEKLAGLS
ncbi:cysteate synthase [Leptolyngbya sp. NIES-2104]|uniref:cysteate synthase n=1 Tax=Leptolyngbya sp. NIES-2104 TaxID=1552121 RepID=UPI0006EC7AA0|nr:cysteate synthase [Leptolyngbya sp. NIES-2104]GAP99528.1 threonine synthase [Leptolyngbya sp. NIES-2104]